MRLYEVTGRKTSNSLFNDAIGMFILEIDDYATRLIELPNADLLEYASQLTSKRYPIIATKLADRFKGHVRGHDKFVTYNDNLTLIEYPLEEIQNDCYTSEEINIFEVI